jgi:hypothetical protein
MQRFSPVVLGLVLVTVACRGLKLPLDEAWRTGKRFI